MVKILSTLSSCLSFLAMAACLPQSIAATAEKPAYFLLAGDSTTASNGGWGDGFLNYTLNAPSTGQNYGHSGATTSSFRAGGDWAALISTAKAKIQDHDVFVTIQVSLPPK